MGGLPPKPCKFSGCINELSPNDFNTQCDRHAFTSTSLPPLKAGTDELATTKGGAGKDAFGWCSTPVTVLGTIDESAVGGVFKDHRGVTEISKGTRVLEDLSKPGAPRWVETAANFEKNYDLVKAKATPTEPTSTTATAS